MSDIDEKVRSSVILIVSYLFPFGQMQDSFFEDEITWLKRHANLKIIPVARKKYRSRHSRYKSFEKEVITFGNAGESNLKKLRWLVGSSWHLLKALFYEYKLAFIEKRAIQIFAKISREGLKAWVWSISQVSPGTIQRPRVIYSLWAGTPGLCALLLSHHFRCGLVIRYHGQDLYEDSRGFVPFNRYVSQRRNVTNVFLGKSAMQYFQNEVSPSVANGVVVPLSVQNLIQAKWGGDPSSLRVLTISNDVLLKRIDLIHQCLIRLAESENISIEWEHAGKLRADTTQILKNNSNNLRFKFLGEMEQSKLRTYMATSDFSFLLSLSESEGMPYSMTQSLSLGIPVISTKVGAIQDIAAIDDSFLLPVGVTPERFRNLFLSLPEFFWQKTYRKEIRRDARLQFSSANAANQILKTLHEAQYS